MKDGELIKALKQKHTEYDLYKEDLYRFLYFTMMQTDYI